jgi:hypothetical protein
VAEFYEAPANPLSPQKQSGVINPAAGGLIIGSVAADWRLCRVAALVAKTRAVATWLLTRILCWLVDALHVT